MSDYGLGRLPAADARDQQFAMRALITIPPTLPKYRYYSVTSILDQGASPTCVGHAWRGWLSAGTIRNLGGPNPYALYDAAQRVDEWPGEDYDGTSVRAGAKVLQSLGFITEYRWAWDASTVKLWLLMGYGPVVFGTNWTRSMFTPDRQGYVRPTGAVVGGHAYLCVGYSSAADAFRFVNSWGRGWGQVGRFWMRGVDVTALLHADGEACTAVEIARGADGSS